jgi:ferredoxin
MPHITTVWVDETCIGCHACVDTAPNVFSLPDIRAAILGAVRSDGTTSPNDERAPLNQDGQARADEISEAVAGCPVECIHVA